MIRKPLPSDRTVDGTEVITEIPHGPTLPPMHSGAAGLGLGLHEKKNLLRERKHDGLFPLVPIALQSGWWCWDPRPDISVPIYLK